MAKKGKTGTPLRTLQAKGEMCTLKTGKRCYNVINIYQLRPCACVCAELKEFALSSYSWSYAQLCMLTQDISQQSYESYIILRDRIVFGPDKSLNQVLWLQILNSDPLHST